MNLEITLQDQEVKDAVRTLVQKKTGNSNIEVNGWKTKKGNAIVASCSTIEDVPEAAAEVTF
jgi:hypothetical protein